MLHSAIFTVVLINIYYLAIEKGNHETGKNTAEFLLPKLNEIVSITKRLHAVGHCYGLLGVINYELKKFGVALNFSKKGIIIFRYFFKILL